MPSEQPEAGAHPPAGEDEGDDREEVSGNISHGCRRSARCRSARAPARPWISSGSSS